MEPTSPVLKRRKLEDDKSESRDVNENLPEKGSPAHYLNVISSATKGLINESCSAKDVAPKADEVAKETKNDIPSDNTRSSNATLTEKQFRNETVEEDVTANTGENSEAGRSGAANIDDFGTVYTTSGITYRLLDKSEDVELFLGKLEKCARFAFDCESIKLGRNNKISVINICLEDGSILLIDIQEIGGIPSRLKSVLEADDIKKVMFDCRSDSDALLHQHQVTLHGIEDLQLMQYIIKNPGKEPAKKLQAFKYTVQEHLGLEKKNLLQASHHEKWGCRPIEQALLKYASIEISMFLLVRDQLIGLCPEDIRSIQRMSEKYADSRRKNDNYDEDDPYESHGFMPLDILRPAYRGDTECVECGIKLDRSQFSYTQRRRGDQKCVVCKAVKVILDRDANREKCFEEEAMACYDNPFCIDENGREYIC